MTREVSLNEKGDHDDERRAKGHQGEGRTAPVAHFTVTADALVRVEPDHVRPHGGRHAHDPHLGDLELGRLGSGADAATDGFGLFC